MLYNEFIEVIVNSRGHSKPDDGNYYEKHHIIPKSIGGSNSKENLVYLLAEEHFIAHKLLAQENPGVDPLTRCFNMMVRTTKNCCKFNERDYEVTEYDYALLREL